MTTKKKLSSAEERRRKRDTRVAALSISQIPEENQRATRALNQALLAGELHDAVILCLKDNKLMPLAAVLRSLIDTCVLGIWFLKYAKDEEITESVAHLSTPDLVRTIFTGEDQRMFASYSKQSRTRTTSFTGMSCILPFTGDALHIAMRIRDYSSRRTWVHKVLFHTNQVYVHLMLEFAKSGLVPAHLHEYFKTESLKSIQMLDAVLRHPGMDIVTSTCLSNLALRNGGWHRQNHLRHQIRHDDRPGQVDGSSIPGGSAMDSFAMGDAEILGLESVNFEVCLNGSALEIRLSNLMVTITFDIDTMALLVKVQADKERVSEGDDWKMIASLPAESCL